MVGDLLERRKFHVDQVDEIESGQNLGKMKSRNNNAEVNGHMSFNILQIKRPMNNPFQGYTKAKNVWECVCMPKCMLKDSLSN